MASDPAPEQGAPLPPGAVHVWLVSLGLEPPALAALGALLGPGERERAAGFHAPQDRERFIAAHGAMRLILAHYLGSDPATVEVEAPRHRPPSLAAPNRLGLRLSLSHSAAWAAVAVTRERAAGVDIEAERPMPEATDLARRFFAPGEAAMLERLPPEARERVFLRLWTAKEAYLKAASVGLSVAAAAVEFAAAADGSLRLAATPPEHPPPHAWSVTELGLGPGLIGALAVAGEAPHITLRHWVWGSPPG